MAESTTTIWLVRHTEPEGNFDGRYRGRLDPPLSHAGREHARQLATHFRAETVGAVWSSGYRRAVETARLIANACNAPLATGEELAEINFGDCEGLTFTEIEQSFPELARIWIEAPHQLRFPNGESIDEVWQRVTRAFHEIRIRHAGETIVVVAHKGPIRILLADALGIPPANIARIDQDFGAVNRLHYIEDVPTLSLVNASGQFRNANQIQTSETIFIGPGLSAGIDIEPT